MGLSINSNIPALNAGRQTRNANQIVQTAIEQLGSGRRINRAADDAAGLAIAERFNTLARQGQVEVNNLQSGYNAAQTAEGGLATQQDATQRLRDLALQASNGTLNDEQREAINVEAQQLVQQIGETAENTEFNETQLLNGSTAAMELGTEGENRLNLPNSTPAALGIDTIDLSTQAGATAAIDQIDSAQQNIDQSRASLGAQQNRFESAINQREIQRENSLAAESAIRDLDFAEGAVDQARGEVLLQGSIGALIQGNVTPQSALRLLGG
ncbi:MAG: flagellin [Candidatus Hydrogenedentota bacterium]